MGQKSAGKTSKRPPHRRRLSVDPRGLRRPADSRSLWIGYATGEFLESRRLLSNTLVFLTPPTNTAAGSNIDSPAGVRVAIEDASGNLISSSDNITIALAANPANDTLHGTLNRPAAAGIVSFPDLFLTKASNGDTLKVSDSTNSSVASATSAPFGITSAAIPTTMILSVIPTSVVAGSSIGGSSGLQVTLLDTYSNVVQSEDTITISLATNPGNSTLSGILAAVANAGIATFTGLSLNKVASGYRLKASDTTTAGVPSGTSNSFSITAAFASQLVFSSQPTNIIVEATLNPTAGVTVQIEDAFGNLVSNRTDSIAVSLSPNAAALSGGLSVSAVGGVANFTNLSITAPGIGDTLTFSDASSNLIAAVTSMPFTIWPVPAAGFQNLSSLSYGSGGDYPVTAGVVVDGSGNLFGTTYEGGIYNDGTVYEISAAGVYTTLLSFTGGSGAYPGDAPEGGLTSDGRGNLFGTTLVGGPAGQGTVFELSGPNHIFSSVLSFTGMTGPYLGSIPEAPLVSDGNGNIFGTTSSGGANRYGTLFELSEPSLTFSSLISFTANSGAVPIGGGVVDLDAENGNIYGTASQGGTTGDGLIFELSGPSYSIFTPIISFTNTVGSYMGMSPDGPVTFDSSGNLYGSTLYGGTSGDGTAFEYSTNGTFTSLVSFSSSANPNLGYNPATGLTFDNSGNLFGATLYGGDSGDGVVFELSGTAHNMYSVCFSFTGNGGADPGNYPQANLTLDNSGNLYGTTYWGGTYGYGSVYEVPASNRDSSISLLSFAYTGGSGPQGSIWMDNAGDIFGTTASGGAYNDGSVFELSSDGTYSTLISFTGNGGDFPGASPEGGLTEDANGNLYGTTEAGGASGDGTVFDLAAPNYTFSLLVSFTGTTGATPGANPVSNITFDSNGDLYGSTGRGGADNDGTIFELSGSNHAFSSLISFTGLNGADPGSFPQSGLAADGDGNLYGTTEGGGTPGQGTVFELVGAGHTFSSLVSFTGNSGAHIGGDPQAGVIFDTNGNFYGTTLAGGASGAGTVFEISGSSHTFSSLVSFTGNNGSDPGEFPEVGLTFDSLGNLYGTTGRGGADGDGTVFELTAGSYLFASLLTFTGNGGNAPGAIPFTGLFPNGNGNLYGTTQQGGTFNIGTIFELTPSHQLAFMQPFTSTTAGAPIAPIEINVEDALGNTNASDTTDVTLSIASGPVGGSLLGTTTVTAVNGVATFTNLSLTVAGAYTLLASDVSLATATSNPFTVNPGMPTELVFTTNPSTTTAGTAIDPTTGVQVAVADSYGNVVNSNDSITLSLSTNPGGTTFTPVTATAVNGVASFTGLVIDQSATGYQFTAADLTNPSYISAQSSLFTINPAAAAAITILGGNNQKTAAGTAFTTPLSVQVTDAFGNLIPAAQITFAAPGSGAGLVTPSLVTATNSAGNISYIASADSTVGAYTVTASVLGVATAATFQLSNAAPLSLFAQPVYLKLDSNRQSLDVFTNTNGAGTPSLQIATNLITSVNVNGFGQSAPLTIDFSNGNPLPSIGVNFIGGGSPPTNTLTLIGSTTGDTILFTATQITIDNTPITYSSTAKAILYLGFGPSSLTINSGTLTLGSSATEPVILSSLSINAGTLDVTNNDMIIHNGNATEIIRALHSGIISSATTNATTLAIELNNDGNGNPLMTTFDNQPVTTTDVLIKFTYYGDTNLDGSVTAADYLAIDNAFSYNATNPATPLTGWNNGDFNYDGVINGDDYTLIDNAFNSQNTVPLVSQAISFPSPTIPQTIAPKTVTFPPAIAQADSSAPIWPFDFNPLNKRKPSLANEIFTD